MAAPWRAEGYWEKLRRAERRVAWHATKMRPPLPPPAAVVEFPWNDEATTAIVESPALITPPSLVAELLLKWSLRNSTLRSKPELVRKMLPPPTVFWPVKIRFSMVISGKVGPGSTSLATKIEGPPPVPWIVTALLPSMVKGAPGFTPPLIAPALTAIKLFVFVSTVTVAPALKLIVTAEGGAPNRSEPQPLQSPGACQWVVVKFVS